MCRKVTPPWREAFKNVPLLTVDPPLFNPD